MQPPVSDEIYSFGDFRLDVAEHLLTRAGAPVALKPKPFELLVVLVRRAGRIVSKEELLREVWREAFVEEANLSVNISVLCKALGCGQDGRKFIETVPKRGYRFTAEVVRVMPSLDAVSLAELATVETYGAQVHAPPAAGSRQVQVKTRDEHAALNGAPVDDGRRGRGSLPTRLTAYGLIGCAVLFGLAALIGGVRTRAGRESTDTPTATAKIEAPESASQYVGGERLPRRYTENQAAYAA